MAKARKSTVKKAKAAGGSKRSTAARRKQDEKIGKTIIGVVIGGVLLAGIGFLATMGYRTAVASKFFDVQTVNVTGTERASADEIKKIVLANSEKTGVWQSDIAGIREKIEKLPFVRSASVSMALPSGLNVSVNERVPVAVVRLASGDQLVDSEGVILAPAKKKEDGLPFAMRGWDESKTPTAMTENLSRLKLYKKMAEDWQQFGLADRVKEVDLSDMRAPSATIEDSGRPIAVVLAKDNLAKGLRSALEAVAGKGEKVRSVNAGGVYPVLEYLNN